MDNTIFQFPLGTEVEFTLSKNRMFDRLVLKGVVIHYFRRPGHQTVLQHREINKGVGGAIATGYEKEVKSYPVDVVQINTKSGGFRVDVDCIITKPTQAMINEVNRLAEEVIKAKEKVVKPKPKRGYKDNIIFKLGDSANIIKPKAVPWLYVASKSSKIFHDVDSPIAKRISANNAVFFKSKEEAEVDGRIYAK